MKGEVFIVWGGNWELACTVKERLEKEGYVVQVGGDENTRGGANYFLGPHVIAQIKRASRTIILAQSKRPIEFRPNLAWEWGYLAGTLLPEYIHVFLIGIRRKDLFTDVLGSWSTELRNGPNDAVAKKVVCKFLSDIKQTEVDPLDVLVNWHSWRQWIERQARGDIAPDYPLVSGVLLHSIQPAFYFGEVQLLRKLVSTITIKPNMSTELPEAKRVTAAACDYYEYTESGPPLLGQMTQIVKSLSHNCKFDSQSPNGRWLEIIRLNFLGLAYRQMSARSQKKSQKEAYARKSRDSFTESQKELSFFDEVNSPIASLWKGYSHRNLGRVYQSLDDSKKAKSELLLALEERKISMSLIRSNNVDVAVDIQLLLEVQSVELDLSDIGHTPSREALAETIEALRVFREQSGVFGIWKRAFLQAKASCKRLGEDELMEALMQLR